MQHDVDDRTSTFSRRFMKEKTDVGAIFQLMLARLKFTGKKGASLRLLQPKCGEDVMRTKAKAKAAAAANKTSIAHERRRRVTLPSREAVTSFNRGEGDIVARIGVMRLRGQNGKVLVAMLRRHLSGDLGAPRRPPKAPSTRKRQPAGMARA